MSNIVLTTPSENQAVAVPVANSSHIVLNFLPDTSTVVRVDNNLVFQFDNNSSISLTDFYTAYNKENLPQFEVEGRIISGNVFFEEFFPDLIPAEGPQSQAESGSRFNQYSNMDIAAGLTHLDGLDLQMQYGAAPETDTLVYGTPVFSYGTPVFSLSQAGNAAGPEDSYLPRPTGPYVRAVLYGPGQADEFVSTNIFFAQGSAEPTIIAASSIDYNGTAPGRPYVLTTSLPDGWQNSWVNISYNATTGRLEFRLTADGIAEMQRAEADGQPLVDFIHVTVTDQNSGAVFEYNVELVATDTENFDSIAHDSLYGDHTGLESIGEYHQGKNETGHYSILSSAQNDEIILNDTLVGGSSIYASASSNPSLMADDYNTIKLNEGVQATQANETTHITSSDGVLTIAKGVAATAQGGGNTIDMGKGSIGITNIATGTAVLADAGQNSITGTGITISGAKNLVAAANGGSNVIHDLDGNVSLASTQSTGASVLAETNGSNLITVENGILNVDAYGNTVKASTGGQNTLEGSGTSTIKINNHNSSGSGITADSGGSNTVTATDSTTVSVIGIQNGLYTSNGSNTVTAQGGAISISGAKTLLNADNGGTNVIHNQGGNATLTSTQSGSTGLLAQNSASNQVMVENGNLNVDVYGPAIKATSGGQNTLEGLDNSAVVINSRSGIGMTADGSGSNTVTATGSSTVDVTGYQYGLYASNGSNTVTAEDGAVTITGTGKTSTGVYAINGLTDIRGGTVDISGNIDGLNVGDGGVIAVAGDKVNITADKGRGVDTYGQGSITITAEDELNVHLTAAEQSSAAVFTIFGTSTLKSGGDINLTVDNGTYETAGIRTYYKGTNNVEAEDDINIKVHAEGPSQYGPNSGAIGIEVSSYGGTNNVTAKQGDITLNVESTVNKAAGIMTSGYPGSSTIIGPGATTITAKEGTLTLNVAGTGGAASAYGIVTNGYATTKVDVNNLDINVSLDNGSVTKGTYGATGISAQPYSKGSTINVTEDLSITVSSGGNASGILAFGAESPSVTNTITAENIDLSVTSTLAGARATGIESSRSTSLGGSYLGGTNNITAVEDASVTVKSAGQAIGIYASANGNSTLTAGDHVDVDVTSTADSAYGIYGGVNSSGTGGVGAFVGDSVTMTITGNLATYAMYGKGSVTASTVTLNAESTNDTSYGMYSTGGNVVQSASGEALHLEINADIAMYNTGAKNSIIGHSVSGGAGDNISINGSIMGSGYNNQITTGAGDDVISLAGSVGAKALYVNGGDGTDTLVLEATSAADFIAKYSAWLNGLTATSFISIEKIEIAGISDLSELQPSLNTFFSYASSANINVSIYTPPIAPFAPFGMETVAEISQVLDSSTDHAADATTQDAAPVASLAYASFIGADALQTAYSTDSEATPLFASLSVSADSVGADVQGAPSGVVGDVALQMEHSPTQEHSPLFANLSGDVSPDTQHSAQPPHPAASIVDEKPLSEAHDSLDYAAPAATSEQSAPTPGMDDHVPAGDAHHADMVLSMGDGSLDFLFTESRTPEGKPSDALNAPDGPDALTPYEDMSLADMGAALAHGPTANTPQADTPPVPQPDETHFDAAIDHPAEIIPDDVQQATATAARQMELG